LERAASRGAYGAPNDAGKLATKFNKISVTSSGGVIIRLALIPPPCPESYKFFIIYNLNQQSEFTFYKLML
jgi:hypothetical protein